MSDWRETYVICIHLSLYLMADVITPCITLDITRTNVNYLLLLLVPTLAVSVKTFIYMESLLAECA